MGLKQPATKIWEIPEPGKAPLTPPAKEKGEPITVPAEPEREKVPVGE
jgi:hypothetical protein